MTGHRSKITLALTMGFGLLLAPSMATAKDPELAFHPAKPWFVGTAPASTQASTGAGLICSIQTEFNNGFIVKLGGSERWIETMVIDFRQDSFKSGDKYDVKLSVPGVKDKVVHANASKNNVLVMDLRGQKDLYHAMRDSGVFDMTLQDNHFRFYLTGLTKTSKEFEHCMAGGDAAPAKGDDVREANAEVNESIALEEKETKKLAMTEIKPEDPKPSAQIIPYTETEKLGDKTIEKKLIVPGEGEIPQAAADSEIETTVEATVDAPADGDKTPILMAKQEADKGRRLSEMLAEEIQQNPEIADVQTEPGIIKDKTEAAAEAKAEEKPVAVVEVEEVTVAPPVEAAIEEQATPAAAEKPAMSDSAIERVRQMAQAQLAEPPALSEPPVLDGTAVDAEAATTTTSADASAAVPLLAEPSTGAAADLTEDAAPAQPDVIVSSTPPAASTQETTTALLNEPGKPIIKKTKIEMAPITPETVGGAPVMDLTEEAAAQPPATTPPVIAPIEAAPPVAAPVDAGPQRIEVPKSPEMKITRQTARMDADFTNLASNEQPAADAPFQARPDGASARKIAELEAAMSDLQKQNASLNEELKLSLHESKEEGLTISSENWNLERATSRFNEAERQVRSLGDQIQKERAQCSMEKKDLETQLFDPQITSEQQLAKLAQLEQKLAEAQAQLDQQRQQYEQRLQAAAGRAPATAP